MKSKAKKFIVPAATRAALVCSSSALAALVGSSKAWADPGQTNLALDPAAGGIASATATNSDFGTTPALGIDGNRDGNFGDGSVWYGNSPNSDGENTNPNTTYNYTVNLGQNDYINRVQFLPRTDADQNVFGNFNISIYPGVPGPGNTVVPAATPSFSQIYNSSYFGDAFATADPGNSANGGNATGSYGQFVSITRLDNNYWLTFAEMEVIGAATPLQNTMSNDIALNKPVTTSSAPGFGALITGGNDGDINGDFNAPNRPVYHSSNHSVGEYWQVDLGADTPLSYAELFARMGENNNTTHEFDVQVYNSAMTLVDSVIVDNSDVNGTTPGYDHEIDLNGVTGEFIRVATTTDSYLSFSELEAFSALIWNNTGGTGDGATWDTTNQNWNNGTAPAVYSGNASIAFNDNNSGHYSVTLNTTVNPASINVNNTLGNYVISGTGQIAGTASLFKNGTGVFTISTASTSLGAVTVNAGTLQLGSSTGQATITSLAITGNGTFDVTNNHVLINYGSGTDPISSIAALLATGYNGGAWNGAGGIVSSAVASNPGYGVGYADSADAGNPAGLASGSIEVAFTLLGDVNLDHVVNGVDFGILAANFNKGVSRWDQGDFNYDNVVNGVDFGELAANFNKGAASASDIAALDAFAAANGLLADVPEPASAGLLVGAMSTLAIRRRARRPA